MAVAGLGFVGRETIRLLQANREKFSRRLGADIVIGAVCDRQVKKEAKALGLGKDVYQTTDPRQLVSHPGIDIIVEVIGGLEDARRLVLFSLESGMNVVTANKRLLAHCWPELQKAAARRGARLYFEASVAGGIPIIEALDNGLAGNTIEAVTGILNGTTNYILSRAQEGIPLQAALKEAQEKGLAEKDPTLDLNGTDTAHKVSVLASLLTGTSLPSMKIAREGIENLHEADLAFAKEELGRTVRLLGSLKLDWGASVGVEAHVFPTLVPLAHPLASVHREFNALLVRASSAGDLMFYGKGAGPGPAASAVVGDVFMLSRDLLGSIPARKLDRRPSRLIAVAQSKAPFYLRFHAQDKPGVLASIAKALGGRGISIATIHQPAERTRWGVPIVLTTHEAEHGQVDAARREILRLGSVAAKHTVLRML